MCLDTECVWRLLDAFCVQRACGRGAVCVGRLATLSFSHQCACRRAQRILGSSKTHPGKTDVRLDRQLANDASNVYLFFSYLYGNYPADYE